MKEYMIWIKAALLCFLAVFIFCIMFTGESDSKTEIADMEAEVMAQEYMGTMQKSDELMIKKVFGLNAADYEGAFYYKGSEALDVCELLIIKLKSDEQSAAVQDAITDRVEEQIQNFTNYGTNQIQLLETCEIEIKGNYCFYVVSEHAAQFKQLFLDSL